jgi:hypothetical protein
VDRHKSHTFEVVGDGEKSFVLAAFLKFYTEGGEHNRKPGERIPDG